MRYGLLALLVLSLCGTANAKLQFAGKYNCKGFDPYLNRPYAGSVVVSPNNTVYKVHMEYNTGEVSEGTGGPYDDNLLSVVFQNAKDPSLVGLEQYAFTPDHKSIEGYWVYLGHDKLGKEVCVKV